MVDFIGLGRPGMNAPVILRSADDVLAAAGTTLGSSSWVRIDQALIDGFAALTGDREWLHVDPARAAAGPFGATVAHGYLTLSLITALAAEILELDGATLRLNYGLDRVRFVKPVPVGTELSLTTTLSQVEPSQAGLRLRFDHVISGRGPVEGTVCVATGLNIVAF